MIRIKFILQHISIKLVKSFVTKNFDKYYIILILYDFRH